MKIYRKTFVGTWSEYKHLMEHIKHQMNEKGITIDKHQFLEEKLLEAQKLLYDNKINTDFNDKDEAVMIHFNNKSFERRME